MSFKLERDIERDISKYPSNHPNRQFWLGALDLAQNNNITLEGSMTPQELVIRESYEWQQFFEERVQVPLPRRDFIEVRERAREAGWKNFACVYFPSERFTKHDKYTESSVKPPNAFWQMANEARDKKLNETVGGWALVDLTKRPYYTNGMQGYRQDFLSDTIEKLREQGRVGSIGLGDKTLPACSRFAIRYDELYEQVLPEMAHALKVDPDQVRLLRFMENSLLANRSFSDFHIDSTEEWFHDKTANGRNIIGRTSEVRAVPNGYRSSRIGFRPTIVFS